MKNISTSSISEVTFSIFNLGGGAYDPEKPPIKIFTYKIVKEWKVDESTWLSAKKDISWDTIGGDYTTTNGAETVFTARNNWEHFNITQIIKEILNSPNNFGFLLICEERDGNSQRKYASSDYADDITKRPKLTIKYSTPIVNRPNNNLKKSLDFKLTNSSIKFHVPYKNYLLTISNAKGQKIISLKENESNYHKISLHNLSTGVHFLNIKWNNKKETLKFINIR